MQIYASIYLLYSHLQINARVRTPARTHSSMYVSTHWPQEYGAIVPIKRCSASLRGLQITSDDTIKSMDLWKNLFHFLKWFHYMLLLLCVQFVVDVSCLVLYATSPYQNPPCGHLCVRWNNYSLLCLMAYLTVINCFGFSDVNNKDRHVISVSISPCTTWSI